MPIGHVTIGVAVHHGTLSTIGATSAIVSVSAVPVSVRIVSIELLLFRPTTTGRHAARTLITAVTATAGAASGVAVVASGASPRTLCLPLFGTKPM